ncbi:hypothetical protein BKA64DRAFT_653409 [Cadophora sp. MPI-SDFR-AT-0126]|nr:hypothetical protein BKA64DRAFT_653409 [Leotiomycetes sp. MPI-SDFR-AT-0126]
MSLMFKSAISLLSSSSMIMHTQPYQTLPSTIATLARLCRQGEAHGTSRSTKRKEHQDSGRELKTSRSSSQPRSNGFIPMPKASTHVGTQSHRIQKDTSMPASAAQFTPSALTYPIAYFPASHRIQPLLQDLDSENPWRTPCRTSARFPSRKRDREWKGKRNGTLAVGCGCRLCCEVVARLWNRMQVERKCQLRER